MILRNVLAVLFSSLLIIAGVLIATGWHAPVILLIGLLWVSGVAIFYYGVLLHRHKVNQFPKIPDEAVIEALANGVVVITQQGKILYSNSWVEKSFNYTRNELRHTNINALIPGVLAHLKEADETDEFELTCIGKNNSQFPARIAFSQLHYSNLNVTILSVFDFTKHNKTTRQKAEFISMVTHELKTPLTSIRGALSLLLKGTVGNLPDQATQLIKIANYNCMRLLLLINDILDLKQVEMGKLSFKLQPVDIGGLVQEAVVANQMYGEQFNVSVELRHIVKDIMVEADPNRLMQVLANLISNAIKFSPPNGVVNVDIARFGDKVRVTVLDHGPGIPDEFRKHIFEPFSQLGIQGMQKTCGTGLGLCISKTMIERLGGTLHFESMPNVETKFYFDLPIRNNSQRTDTDA